ncbi:hypothetical protein LMG9449_2678 [Lactococcus lactis subsp. lactis]|uniref:Uncharacterized protein n=1 Tax=Lactococcus lactis subsp. lactis TaxID=1360 RepID=A0A0V8DKP2_LACLL|nr:hypothetical protein [Lactococcus lactis]KSU14031.1 hypothetical protein LMG9449_2678 [Lactococcus lactis subsp. lactis]MDT2863641.1 hypothetical protein [Lactococcus lactis]
MNDKQKKIVTKWSGRNYTNINMGDKRVIVSTYTLSEEPVIELIDNSTIKINGYQFTITKKKNMFIINEEGVPRLVNSVIQIITGETKGLLLLGFIVIMILWIIFG